jgi:hypothetical protein
VAHKVHKVRKVPEVLPELKGKRDLLVSRDLQGREVQLGLLALRELE